MIGKKNWSSVLLYRKILYLCRPVLSPSGEMVDTLVSGASASRHVGSSPISGTYSGKRKNFRILPLFRFNSKMQFYIFVKHK